MTAGSGFASGFPGVQAAVAAAGASCAVVPHCRERHYPYDRVADVFDSRCV
jgi:hypothetical protein